MNGTEFLEVVREFENEVVTAKTVFSYQEDGVSVASRRRNSIEYKRKLSEAIEFMADIMEGRKHPYLLQEVMTRSDFPLLFGDILDRTVLAKYNEWPASWTAYAKRAVVNDFRDASLIPPVYGVDGPLDIVGEVEPYPDANLTEQAHIKLSVKKYGRRVPISWETLINDNLNMLSDIPERLARAARRTEHRLVTGLFVDANGPHASFFTGGNKNQVITANGSPAAVGNNPALSINALQAAYIVLSKLVDEMGEPIMRDVLTLVVPPALEVPAMNIVNAIQIQDSSLLGGGQPDNNSTTGERRLIVNNWMRNRLNVVVDPYIPIIATTNGNTSWFVFADPNYSREAIRIGFLRGHESPEIWMKSPNAMRVGGGDVGAFSGDFDSDAIEYRIRHVTGAVRVDPKAAVASNGTGS